MYGVRSSRSTKDLLTFVSDRIVRAFNISETSRAVALDISKAFDRAWHTGLLHKLKSDKISGQIFELLYFFLSNRRLRVVLDWKSSQEYPINASWSFLMMLYVILLSMLMIVLSILSVARHLTSLPIECFPLTYDLSGFKSRINKRLLTVGSF